jgi:dolichol-phosphate mannosyltransferase
LGGGGRTAFACGSWGDALVAGVGVGEGAAAGVGAKLGGADGRGDRARLDDAAVAFTAAVGCGLVERAGWLQPATTSRAIPVQAMPALRIRLGSGFVRLKTLSGMRTQERPLLSIVVPLYNEAANVAPLVERIGGVVDRLRAHYDYEIVLVNDGSSDGTRAAARQAMEHRSNVILITLSRNFGHQLAATAGLEIARGDAVILMDGDLQDPPELIEAFVSKWREGYDVVYAVRRTRSGESRFKLFTARLFYRIIKRLTKVSIPVDAGDFRLMSRRVVDALRRSPERNRFLRGMVSWVGFNQTAVAYDRDVRHAGTTKYPLSKMVRFAMDGITSFSDIPLRFASYLGFTVSAIAFLYAIYVIISKVFNVRPLAYTPGWASTIVAVLFLGGVQLMSLGILGEYLGRVYDEVKGRPLYLISEVERS